MCTLGPGGKEKQVVSSIVQLTEANWTHLSNVSSSVQYLLWKYWRNVGGGSIESQNSEGKDVRIWPSIDQHHLPQDGQDTTVKGLWGHGYGAAGLIVMELGDQGLEILLYPAPDPCSLLAAGGFSGGEIWTTYCPIVPLWPTYMGLASVGGSRAKEEEENRNLSKINCTESLSFTCALNQPSKWEDKSVGHLIFTSTFHLFNSAAVASKVDVVQTYFKERAALSPYWSPTQLYQLGSLSYRHLLIMLFRGLFLIHLSVLTNKSASGIPIWIVLITPSLNIGQRKKCMKSQSQRWSKFWHSDEQRGKWTKYEVNCTVAVGVYCSPPHSCTL